MTQSQDLSVLVRMNGRASARTRTVTIQNQPQQNHRDLPRLGNISLSRSPEVVRSRVQAPHRLNPSALNALPLSRMRTPDYSKFRNPELSAAAPKIDNKGQDLLKPFKLQLQNKSISKNKNNKTISPARMLHDSPLKVNLTPQTQINIDEKTEMASPIKSNLNTSLQRIVGFVNLWKEVSSLLAVEPLETVNPAEPVVSVALDQGNITAQQQHSVPQQSQINLIPNEIVDLEEIEDRPAVKNTSFSTISSPKQSPKRLGDVGDDSQISVINFTYTLPSDDPPPQTPQSHITEIEDLEENFGSLSFLRVPSFDFDSPFHGEPGTRNVSVGSLPSLPGSLMSRGSLLSRGSLTDPTSFVNYPEDKRPSRRLPMRATSRRSTINKNGFSKLFCCCRTQT